MQSNAVEPTAHAVADIRLFGEFRIKTRDGDPISLSNKRGTALLAILCLQPSHSIEREALGKLLWPNRFAPQMKASLRQCLHDLVQQLRENGLELLEVSRSAVALKTEAFSSDLDDLVFLLGSQSALDTQNAIGTLLDIGNQPILEGLSLNNLFDEWLEARSRLAEARIRAAVLARLERSRDDPDYNQLIEAARTRFPTVAHIDAAAGSTSVAVLPFAQTDEIGGDFYLADGITDELTSQLAKVRGIAIAGRTSILAVSAKGGLLTDMASSLKVSYLVEGEVRREVDRIKVRIALIEGTAGTEIWSDHIEGTFEEFFESRKVIGANVISAMCRALGITATLAPSRRMTADREAYSLYLQGRSLTQRSLQDGAASKAVELLERSLEIDPDFAECWSALADAHIHTAVYTPCLDRIAQSEKAADCARRAIELDPSQGHALAIQGIHEWTKFNPARALDLAFEAYARDPQNADVASRLGSFLLYIGRSREALPFIEAAVEQDPVYGRNHAMLMAAHFNLGNFGRAIAAGQRMVDLGMPGMWLAVVLAANGDQEAAAETYYDSRKLMNTVILPPAGTEPMSDEARDAYWSIAAKGCCSGEESNRAAYCQLLSGLHATMPDPHDPSIAFPAIWMGHVDLVMKIYRERIHPANMFGLMSLWADVEPIRRIRKDPGFISFAEDIGLVEAWNRHGWPDLLSKDPRRT